MKKIDAFLMKNTTLALMTIMVLIIVPALMFPGQRGAILLYVVPTVMYGLATGIFDIKFRTRPKIYTSVLTGIAAYFTVATNVIS